MIYFLIWSLGIFVGVAAARSRGFSIWMGIGAGWLLGPLLAWVLFVEMGHSSVRCSRCGTRADPNARFCKNWQSATLPDPYAESNDEPRPAVRPTNSGGDEPRSAVQPRDSAGGGSASVPTTEGRRSFLPVAVVGVAVAVLVAVALGPAFDRDAEGPRMAPAGARTAPSTPAISSPPPAPALSPPPPQPGSDSRRGVQTAREKCAKDWPDDFTVRAYCEEQQQIGHSKLESRTMSSANERTIRRKCASDSPDDFMVRDYCEEQQLKALRELGR